MKGISMKIPPLAQLYQQKSGYNAHQKKLRNILLERKQNRISNFLQLEHLDSKQKHSNFYQRCQIKKSILQRQNNKIVNKIADIKASKSLRNVSDRQYSFKPTRSVHSKLKLFEQTKQNNRIKIKVNSLSSSLNSKNLLKDYRKSESIKKRIMHFKTQDNKVVLKANKYIDQNRVLSSQSTPKILKYKHNHNQLPNLNKNICTPASNRQNIPKNIANYYRKQEILKNRIQSHNKNSLLRKYQSKTQATDILQQMLMKNEKRPTFFISTIDN